MGALKILYCLLDTRIRLKVTTLEYARTLVQVFTWFSSMYSIRDSGGQCCSNNGPFEKCEGSSRSRSESDTTRRSILHTRHYIKTVTSLRYAIAIFVGEQKNWDSMVRRSRGVVLRVLLFAS